MFTRVVVCFVTSLALVATGCSKEEAPPTKGEAHDHDHAGHDHDHAAHDHDHANEKTFDLGKAAAGSVEVTAIQIGLVTPGKKSELEVELSADLPQGSAVRAWIGESTTATKTAVTYDADHKHYHATVPVPMPLPPGAKWWIEVEPSGKSGSAVSFPLKP